VPVIGPTTGDEIAATDRPRWATFLRLTPCRARLGGNNNVDGAADGLEAGVLAQPRRAHTFVLVDGKRWVHVGIGARAVVLSRVDLIHDPHAAIEIASDPQDARPRLRSPDRGV